MNQDQVSKLWDCIHIFSKTFDPTDPSHRECFVCFFECIKDLLPDPSYRSYFSSFLSMYPPQYSIVSQQLAFEWTYKFRLMTILSERKQGKPVPIITLPQLQYQYELITKEDWSRAVWFVIHFLTANLSSPLDPDTKLTVKAFCVCLRYLLPCPKCKSHMELYLAQHPIDSYFTSCFDVFRWTCEYHETVNVFDRSKTHEPINIRELYNQYRILPETSDPSRSYEIIDDLN